MLRTRQTPHTTPHQQHARGGKRAGNARKAQITRSTADAFSIKPPSHTECLSPERFSARKCTKTDIRLSVTKARRACATHSRSARARNTFTSQLYAERVCGLLHGGNAHRRYIDTKPAMRSAKTTAVGPDDAMMTMRCCCVAKKAVVRFINLLLLCPVSISICFALSLCRASRLSCLSFCFVCHDASK